ncbi:hypothetical protein BJX66DRAFT_343990 [Aspergillus keveii]|uniref:Fungal N-terminal domain-containing protein n=1 Tax=Aspergillus keveii TaxID=714993 RepID=A0ABR4FML7_9EURO
MASPIGFSIADFITLGKLIHDLIGAFNERNGATGDYQSFVSTLRSLYTCTNAIKDVVEDVTRNACSSYSPTSPQMLRERAILNRISHELSSCKGLINSFLEHSYKYTTTLLPLDKAKGFLGIGKRPSCIGTEEADSPREVRKALEENLVDSLQLYEGFLQHMTLCRVETDITELTLLTRNLRHASGDLQLHPAVYRQQAAQAAANHIPNCNGPLHLEQLQRHIEIIFAGTAGHKKIKQRQYFLEEVSTIRDISPGNYDRTVTAGAHIAMTVLSRLTLAKKMALPIRVRDAIPVM